ncbi:uncharacterized protein LOC141858270 [Brevipalpus obovatus]|uniref:uncharacterized protein LOC141858270 n=1 Tax=Brevipalpus obovatus TaxID=246614 RepID=UPI003D9FAA9D
MGSSCTDPNSSSYHLHQVISTKSSPACGTASQNTITAPSHHFTEQFLHEKEDIQENDGESLNLEQLRQVNRYAESTKSLSFLPIVHERQTQRMKTRSEWFLNPNDNVHWMSLSHS